MTVKTPEQTLADTIAAVMGRRRLSLTDVAERMADVGYAKWSRQTVAEIVKAKRSVRASELYALAVVLEIPLPALVMPWTEEGAAWIELPNGVRLRYFVETRFIRPFGDLWDGNKLKISPGETLNQTYAVGPPASHGEAES